MTAAHDDAGSADREIVITRSFDAPRKLVFDAWTDPTSIGAWWGPNGFTTTTSERDVRPGGTWRFVMHGPDGTNYDNRISYVEIEPPARLVYLHDSDKDDDPEQFHVTVTFDEQGGKTTLTLRIVASTSDQRNRMLGYGAIEGGKQTLERLAEHLAANP